MTEEPTKLLSLNEAAKQLDYQPGGLRKIVNRTKKGKPGAQIRFFQVGTGPIKFKQEWLDDFVAENSIMPGRMRTKLKPKPVQRREVVHIEPQWGISA